MGADKVVRLKLWRATRAENPLISTLCIPTLHSAGCIAFASTDWTQGVQVILRTKPCNKLDHGFFIADAYLSKEQAEELGHALLHCVQTGDWPEEEGEQ